MLKIGERLETEKARKSEVKKPVKRNFRPLFHYTLDDPDEPEKPKEPKKTGPVTRSEFECLKKRVRDLENKKPQYVSPPRYG